VDREIGRLLSGIERQMSVDQALIALTADHGESMLEHEAWFTHGYQVYDEIVRVPLMLRGPGVIPGRRTELASGVDLMRTILAFAGEEVSGSTRAVDLRERKLPDDRAVFVEAAFASHWRGVVQGAGKWILELPRGEAKVVSQRYYDLEGDPEERTAKTPLPDSGALRHLKELVARDPDPGGVPQDSKRGIRLTAPKVAPRATEEQLDRLRALGYAE
jgi:arylsulfatase A-like enzyme